MKLLIALTLSLFALNMLSQEMVSPLLTNKVLTEQSISKQANRSINGDYIYALDTVHLPFKDDFSKDLFKKYNATPTDTNVTDTLFYAVSIGGIPVADTITYMEDTTYRLDITKFPNDSLSIDSTPQASILITYCDLDVYPVICVSKTVWPASIIVDTVSTPNNPDTTIILFPADIVQDSAQVYFVQATDTVSRWIDNQAFLNSTYAFRPPTIGVATFDGLNENGFPYDFSTAFTYGEADKLTSKPIYLGRDENNQPYSNADSLYLSFYYQPEGLGNEPEIEDSLVLQFWSPITNDWSSVWKSEGMGLDVNFSPDSSFRIVMVPINDNKYFADGFQFRFVNYASLSGSFDHWNIDYVYLEDVRFKNDTIFDDVAFTNPVTTLLKNYTAMPWKHYFWDKNGFMLDSVVTKQQNINNTGKLISNNNIDIYYNGSLIQNINNPNTPSVNGFTRFETIFDIGNGGFFFDTTVNDTCATFNVRLRHRTTPDACRNNDTIDFDQVFADYYAYDDGSAEQAYGVQGVGGVTPRLASKFTILQGDTLKALKIHFSPSADNNSNSTIIITVWADDGSGKPGTIIHENITLATPEYNLGVNGFFDYLLDSNVFIPAGNYYVGWQQTSSNVINVGYDRSINNNANTFFSSNGLWTNSGQDGTMMIRPTFVSEKDYVVGIEELNSVDVTIYPNPSQDFIYLKSDENINQLPYTILNINGKLIANGAYNTNGIDLRSFDNGVYFIEFKLDTKSIFKKVIKN